MEINRLEFERDLWSREFTLVAGVDEAGRGPLAGPVVAVAAAGLKLFGLGPLE
jgi:ribonuclease HII